MARAPGGKRLAATGRVLRIAVAAALSGIVTGCIVPIAIPSTRVEGGYTPQGAGSLRVGSHVAGYRLARDPQWDLGAGYTLTTSTFDPMVNRASGFYFEGAYLRRIDRSARLSVGPGISMLFRGDRDALLAVAYARIGVEMFQPVRANVSSDGKCGTTTGTWHGQLGLGAYIDIEKPIGESGVAAVIGVSGRIPSFAGVGFYIPYCK
jgi:hypothetical protein